MFITLFTGVLSVNLVWTEPNHWVGPPAALYQSFDGLDGIVLMEGSQEVCHAPLMSGKVKTFSELLHRCSIFSNIHSIHT